MPAVKRISALLHCYANGMAKTGSLTTLSFVLTVMAAYTEKRGCEPKEVVFQDAGTKASNMLLAWHSDLFHEHVVPVFILLLIVFDPGSTQPPHKQTNKHTHTPKGGQKESR